MIDNSLNKEENKEEIKENKLTYIDDLWMYLDDIKERYLTNRNKIKDIINIFTQKSNLEINISSEIKTLCDKYISKYKKKDETQTQCECAIDKMIDIIIDEMKIIEEKTNYITNNFIKPLNTLLNDQFSISNQIIRLDEKSHDDFKLINQLLREKELSLMKVGKSIESLLYKLERATIESENKKEEKKIEIKEEKKEEKKEEESKENIKEEKKEQIEENKKDDKKDSAHKKSVHKKDSEHKENVHKKSIHKESAHKKSIYKDKNKKEKDKKGQDINKNKDNQNENNIDEKPENIEEIIVSCKKEKESLIKKAKVILFEYESFINIANEEKDKFLMITKKIYNQFQILDEEFISKIKILFKGIYEKDDYFNKQIFDIKNNFLKNYINLIDVENDINSFINSKVIKFNTPGKIECIYYTPQIVLKNRNDPFESKLTEKINNELNSIFLKSKKKDKNTENNNFIFIKNCIKLILQEKEYDKDKLLILLKQKEYRALFFEALNQYRIEGIFELQQKTFDELSNLFKYIINFAKIEEDYASFKSLIILSQTFYLVSNKSFFLNKSIKDNEIWKEKNFWEKIIDYAIKDELNNTKDFYLFLEEGSKSRKVRISSAITSSIITFIFNMKLFNYPEENYKEIIDDLIKIYKIDGSSVYATLDSINNVIEVDANKQNNIQNNNNDIQINNNDIQNNNNNNDNQTNNNIKDNNKNNEKEGNEDKTNNQKNENL